MRKKQRQVTQMVLWHLVNYHLHCWTLLHKNLHLDITISDAYISKKCHPRFFIDH